MIPGWYPAWPGYIKRKVSIAVDRYSRNGEQHPILLYPHSPLSPFSNTPAVSHFLQYAITLPLSVQSASMHTRFLFASSHTHTRLLPRHSGQAATANITSVLFIHDLRPHPTQDLAHAITWSLSLNKYWPVDLAGRDASYKVLSRLWHSHGLVFTSLLAHEERSHSIDHQEINEFR